LVSKILKKISKTLSNFPENGFFAGFMPIRVQDEAFNLGRLKNLNGHLTAEKRDWRRPEICRYFSNSGCNSVLATPVSSVAV
jgi:hypothetical protein